MARFADGSADRRLATRMTLSHEVTLSLSNEDFMTLVADALDRKVLYTPSVDVTVMNIDWGDTWDITFIMEGTS